MKPISAEQLIEGLSDDLQDLLIREAYIRRRAASLPGELEEKRRQAAGLQQTRPSFLIFRGKGAKEEFESTGVRLSQEITALEKTLRDGEIILRKCGRIIESGLEEYFESRSESFRNARAAQDLIPEWESAVGLYRACLRQLVMTLGIARNQMSSGYDRKAGSLSGGALAAFGSALSAAKSVEAEALIPNRLAKKYREQLGIDPSPLARMPNGITVLPYLPDLASVKRITAIKTAPFEAARTEVGRLLTECEKSDENLPAFLDEAKQVQASQEARYRQQIAGPLAEIRALADGSVEPANAAEVWASMESRFVSLTG